MICITFSNLRLLHQSKASVSLKTFQLTEADAKD